MSESIRDMVQAQVEQKIAAGEALQAAIDGEQRAQDALEEAQRGSQSARRDAMRAGWSENELKRLGLASASKRRRGSAKRVDEQSGQDHEG